MTTAVAQTVVDDADHGRDLPAAEQAAAALVTALGLDANDEPTAATPRRRATLSD